MRAPDPANEEKRLDSLLSFNVLDTDFELMFDDLVRVASHICQTPIAAISLVDRDRQWFKSILGLATRETPRDLSFCAHAILNPEELFVVEDARQDERFEDNAMVTGDPGIRFYAGMPLVAADGQALGTICVIDRVVRSLSEGQRDALRALARQVSVQLEYRRAVSALQEQAKELELARQEALKSKAAKEAFMATINHELRTPMNGVIGISGMLRKTGLTSFQSRLIDTLEESASSLMVVLNDIIEFSNSANGRISLRPVSFQPDKLVEDLVRVFRPMAESKGLRLVSAGTTVGSLQGDVIRIRQSLTALIDNAVKYSKSGSIQVEAHEIRRTGGEVWVRFSVEDQGVGIPEDRQADVISSFQQGETGYTRTYSGMGLGLSLCQSLIERMSGQFGFESKVDSGSRFWFEIPLGLAESDSVAKMDNADAPKSLTGCRILVAEDNLVNALVLVSMLERFGCKVVSVSNGQEAVDALKVEPFDAVLMDLQMPVLDGIAATAEVRHMSTDAANVPVIAITASTQESDREACANVGMNDFICKPIDEDIVRLALTRWISA